MSGETSMSWTHTVSDTAMLLVWCPCGIAHEVHNAERGGMSMVDCPCGMQVMVEHER